MMFFLTILRPPRSSPFPYTTLFRSRPVTFSRPSLRGTDRPMQAPSMRFLLPSASHPSYCALHQNGSFHRLPRSEEHTSELQSHLNLASRLLLEQNKNLLIYTPLQAR